MIDLTIPLLPLTKIWHGKSPHESEAGWGCAECLLSPWSIKHHACRSYG